MADATYVVLHEAEDLAEQICRKYPEELCEVELETVGIVAIEGKDRPERSNKLATIKTIKPPVSLYTGGKTNIIEIYMSDWEEWTTAQRNMALFHELYHITSENKQRKHDLEDFVIIVRKFGVDYFGNPDLVDILSEDVDWSVYG